jgi:hypothetical protein
MNVEGGRTGGGRRSRVRVRLTAMLVAVLVAFVVAEIAARMLYPVVHQVRHFEPGMFLADPERGWVPRPGYVGVFAEFLSETGIRVNRLGLRGPEVDPADRSAALRVLCVGDSNTFGLGVEEGDAYSQYSSRFRTGTRPHSTPCRGQLSMHSRQRMQSSLPG